MFIRYLYIMRLMLAVLMPILLALHPAKAQTIVYQGTITTFEVIQVPGNTYQWELYNDSTLNFAVVAGNCPVTSARFTTGNMGPSVNVEWLQPGIYFYKVTARDAALCTTNLKIGKLKVITNGVIAVNTGTTRIGACQSVRLDASTSSSDMVKYEWTVIDQGGLLTNQTGNSIEFSLSPTYTATLPADFRVRLQATDKNGLSFSDTISIKIDNFPIADISSAGLPEKDGSMMVDGSVSKGSGLVFKWSSSDGKIIGPIDKPSAFLLGAGIYTLKITDIYGCESTKTFKFPIDLYQVTANPDYVRTSWTHDTTIFVLNNDFGTAPLIPGSVRVIQTPQHGKTRINPDGSILYIPDEKTKGRDQFIYEVCDAVDLCDSALVTIDISEEKIILPEGFSPNGDGQNDLFIFNGLEKYSQSRLSVFTRSGQLIYESKDYRNNWDGKANVGTAGNSTLVPTGTYYYVLELGGTTKTIKGFIYVAY
jgi:gliding motility-associated-like protein